MTRLWDYDITVTAGSTFDSVALEIYGDEKYACELMNANPEQCSKLVFTGGERLRVPIVFVPQRAESGIVYQTAEAPWRK